MSLLADFLRASVSRANGLRRSRPLFLALVALVAATACSLPPFQARDASIDRAVPSDGLPTDTPSSEIMGDSTGEIVVLPSDAGDATVADATDVTLPPTDGGDAMAPDVVAAPLRLLWVSVTAVDSTELNQGGASLRDLRFETAARTCVGEICGSIGVRP